MSYRNLIKIFRPELSSNTVQKAYVLQKFNEILRQNEPIGNSPCFPYFYGKFNANEVPSLIGKNEYKSRFEGVYSLLMKEPEFAAMTKVIKWEGNIIESRCLKYIAILAPQINLAADYISGITGATDLSEIIHYKTEEIVGKLGSKIAEVHTNQKLRERLKSLVRTQIRLIRGSKLQEQSLVKLQKTKNTVITRGNHRVYQFACNEYSLSGSIDGIIERDGCIVEIKNRVTPESDIVNKADKIQCLIYLKLTGYKKCLLVEHFPNLKTRETLVRWNQRSFDVVHRELCKVIAAVRKLTKRDLQYMIKRDVRFKLKF